MSTPAARRRAIARATADARQAAIARREAAAAVARQGYETLADQVAQWLAENASADGSVSPEALALLEGFLADALARLAETWQVQLDLGLTEAASLAAAVRPAEVVDIGPTVGRTLQFVRDFTGADGLQLSDRVWRVNELTRRTVAETIRGAVLRGSSARQAAHELLASGEAVTAELAATARAAQAKPLASTVSNALLRDTHNPMRHALRVMRTEINRAFTESFVDSAFQHPDVEAVKFNLSPLHPRFDVCDLHARANLHGLGPGVYPKNQHPYPAHPETLSYLTVVFVDEISEADRAGQETPLAWLARQGHDVQEGVLGKNKARALRGGRLLESEWNAPWRQVRARLESEP